MTDETPFCKPKSDEYQHYCSQFVLLDCGSNNDQEMAGVFPHGEGSGCYWFRGAWHLAITGKNRLDDLEVFGFFGGFFLS